MSWLDLVNRTEGIRAVFSEVEPSLDTVRLHEMIFHQDGPQLTLRFDLIDFPLVPPPKWVKAECNTVQLILVLYSISEVRLEGWARDNIGEIDIQPHIPKGFAVEFASDGSKLMAICDFVFVESISAYQNSVKT